MLDYYYYYYNIIIIIIIIIILLFLLLLLLLLLLLFLFNRLVFWVDNFKLWRKDYNGNEAQEIPGFFKTTVFLVDNLCKISLPSSPASCPGVRDTQINIQSKILDLNIWYR